MLRVGTTNLGSVGSADLLWSKPNSQLPVPVDPEAEERDLPPLKCQRSDTSATLLASSPAHLSSWERGNKSDRVRSLLSDGEECY